MFADFQYLPYEKRQPDHQYGNLLCRIRNHGQWVTSQQEEDALMIIGHQMRFPLRNGFPIITERDLLTPAKEGGMSQFHMALAELCAFLNGARTLDQMKQFGCGWWSRWVTPEKCAKRGLEPGDLGPGSYGAAWRNFPTADGKSFDQIKHLIEQIEELPHLRTHFVSPWIPQYIGRGKGKQQKVVVAPCHGWLHFFADPMRRTMSLHHFQRSADTPVGLVFNFIQYAALLLMIAQVTDYEPDELVYTTSDTHIFAEQLDDVDEILSVKSNPFPTVTVDPKIKNIFDFRPEHFTVTDYHPVLKRMVIHTPV